MSSPFTSVIYRNSRAAAVFYAVPFRLAQQRLEGTGLFAVRIGDYGIVNATWFDYGETSIGPYREFSLGIVASPEQHRLRLAIHLITGSKPSLGSFVLALPVDLEVARAGGVQQFNLPKSLVQFGMKWSDSELQASIASTGGSPNDSGVILSMTVPLRVGIPIRVGQLTIYSVQEGKLLATGVNTQWPAKLDLVSRPALTVIKRSHPIGNEMAGLALETSRVLAVVHGPLQYAALPLLHGPGPLEGNSLGATGGSPPEAPHPKRGAFSGRAWSQTTAVTQPSKEDFDIAGPSTVRSRTD